MTKDAEVLLQFTGNLSEHAESSCWHVRVSMLTQICPGKGEPPQHEQSMLRQQQLEPHCGGDCE